MLLRSRFGVSLVSSRLVLLRCVLSKNSNSSGVTMTELPKNYVELFLPMPPSANRIWRSGRGRVYRSDKYTDWLDDCREELIGQRPGFIGGRVSIDIEVSSKWRGDVDNRIKPTLDCLVKFGVIEDDGKKFVRSVRAFWSDELADGIRVKIERQA